MWIDKLERKFNRIGIPKLMLYIVIGTAVVFLFDYMLLMQGGGVTLSSMLQFNRELILSGQVWRIITFVLVPPRGMLFLILISLYFYYFVGTTLERAWGSNKFTLYYLIGIIGCIVSGFITGETTAGYLNLSLFFAFAALFPEQKVLLFFVIPIKIKWLGYLNGAFFAYSILTNCMYGYWPGALAAIMAIVNFLIFFGPSFIGGLRQKAKWAKSRREFQDKSNNSWNNQ